VSDLTSTAGIVALAAGGVAIVALATSVALGVSLRRMRRAQRVVLGEENTDLVAHAAALQSEFQALSDYVGDAAARLDARVSANERRLDGTVAYRSLVRYDAYGEMSGRQSTSIALLDAQRSGIVLSSIHHREHARLYAKLIREGRSDLELSPEENEAIRLALKGGEVLGAEVDAGGVAAETERTGSFGAHVAHDANAGGGGGASGSVGAS
jgi:Protein of unknown function (DUF4446)